MFDLGTSEIEAIRNGCWELPCSAMELRRRDERQSFSGSGIIRQDERRRLKFTLIDKEHTEGFRELIKGPNSPEVKAGQLVPHDVHFKLIATDSQGRRWTADHLFDFSQNYGNGECVILEGTVPEIRCKQDVSFFAPALEQVRGGPVQSVFESLYVNYRLFWDIGDFPCNAAVEKTVLVGGRTESSSSSWGVSKHESEHFTFELFKDEEGLKFTVEGKTSGIQNNNHADLRFAEALQFVLGRPFDWEIQSISIGNEKEICVRPRAKGGHDIRMFPPILFERRRNCEEFWNLFQKYLDSIWSYDEKGWHPLSRRTFTLQHGSSALWPIRMLTAGIEVEGVLNDHFDKSMPPPCELKAAVDTVLELINVAERIQELKDAAVIERIRSSLGLLKSSSSARNKLHTLAGQSRVRRDDVDAWEHIRNKSAHAIASETLVTQENITRLDRVLVLFYHLIFHLVGYKGPYTDYGELGYPTKQYPPPTLA